MAAPLRGLVVEDAMKPPMRRVFAILAVALAVAAVAARMAHRVAPATRSSAPREAR
jgi:hypothetical protein